MGGGIYINTADRKDHVLSSIIELFVVTGEPVGSKAVSIYLNDMCSTATIRNDMCDLIERGYLIQPHTSAGRIPSAMGYRYYIDHLMPFRELPTAISEQIDQVLPSFRGDSERFLSDTCKALANITGCTAMITTPADPNATLKRIELIPAGRSSVMVAVLSSSGSMKCKLCHLDCAVSIEELARFSVVVNERFADLRLSHINPAMAQTLVVSFGIMALKFAPVFEQIFEAAQETIRTTVQVEGQTNLLLYKEFSPASVVELFTNKDRLVSYLEQPSQNCVLLGNELNDAALRQAGLIVEEYRFSSSLFGKIAVLGPMKMNYVTMIPMVTYIAKKTEQALCATLL